ncbi:MAG: SLBB domain-containing protein [Deltaproteobacteria bacterium]|jgi:NADH-quinone oxidoreductase subunit F|nr:SLBB domain-containing protein [Deltaproteobacteria bacterium]
MKKTLTLITAGADAPDPLSVSAYESVGGFKGLKKALTMTPAEIVREVLAAKLLGRGGAAYPAGKKWEQLLKIPRGPKYVVANADEGEPGTFKDRLIMDKVPFGLLEGMAVAGHVFGARNGYVYVRGEYRLIGKKLRAAIETLKAAGRLGENILGSGFSFDVKVVSGAGAYVCGENSALLNSTEGKAGRPRIKPPHLAEVGLFLKPTLVNNVETFACVPSIVAEGGERFLSLGHPEGGGTKLVCLSGRVKNPGVYEIPLGRLTLRELIFDPELGGGMREGDVFNFAHLGGQSGPIAGIAGLDAVYAHSELKKASLAVGSGAIVVMDRSVGILDYLRRVSEFFAGESCGKCVPCREGNGTILRYLKTLEDGEAGPEELRALSLLAETMARASFCGLGQAAPTALESARKIFPEEFEGRVRRPEDAEVREAPHPTKFGDSAATA